MRLQRNGKLPKHLLLRNYLESEFCEHYLATRGCEIKAHLKKSNFGIPEKYEDPESCSYRLHLEHVSQAFLQARAELRAMRHASVDKHAEVYANFAILFLDRLRNMTPLVVASEASSVTNTEQKDAVWCAWTIGSKPCLQLLQMVSPPVFAFATSDVAKSDYEDAACYD